MQEVCDPQVLVYFPMQMQYYPFLLFKQGYNLLYVEKSRFEHLKTKTSDKKNSSKRNESREMDQEEKQVQH